MFFMRFPIDAVFLDRDLVVDEGCGRPRSVADGGQRGAKAVLELPAGAASGLQPGDRLVLA